jgi:HAD superfamily hydrolase (TIGR01484 family)
MKYKMLVLDMDDTLLTDDHRISEKNKSAIAQAQEAGVKVVLASGRPTPAMLSYAKELGLHQNNSYILAYNGAVILDMTTKRYFLNKVLAKKIFMLCMTLAKKTAYILLPI